MAITTEQIFAVADELDAAGQNPTLAAVRKGLGGGSFTTISEAMTEWKARKVAKETPLREPAPAMLVERLTEFGAELWGSALELANGRLAAERTALETSRTQLEAEKAEAAELADQVTAELEEAKARVSALETVARTAHEETESLRGQLAEASGRAMMAEVRVAEIEKRADDLNAELARVHQQNVELVRTLSEAVKGKPEDASDV